MRGGMIAAVAASAALALGGCAASGPAPSPSASFDAVQVQRGDLSSTLKWTGVLTYDNPFPVVYQVAATATTTTTSRASSAAATTPASSIVTWVAPPGTVLHSGDVAYRVDNVPVVFLEGDAVLWRDLSVGSEGSDVQAVETSLKALGYDPHGYVTADTYYRSSTATMVEAFQTAFGLSQTGTLDYRSTIMRPGDVIVTDETLAVGDSVSSGATVMTVSDTTRVVTFPITPDQRPQVQVGDTVQARLPSGDTATAAVSLVAASLDSSTGTYAVTALFPDPLAVTGDKIDVSVTLVVPLVTNALLVPPEAIVVRDDGTTTVRVVKGGELVPVTVSVLGSAGQLTAVSSGDLTETDTVAVG